MVNIYERCLSPEYLVKVAGLPRQRATSGRDAELGASKTSCSRRVECCWRRSRIGSTGHDQSVAKDGFQVGRLHAQADLF